MKFVDGKMIEKHRKTEEIYLMLKYFFKYQEKD